MAPQKIRGQPIASGGLSPCLMYSGESRAISESSKTRGFTRRLRKSKFADRVPLGLRHLDGAATHSCTACCTRLTTSRLALGSLPVRIALKNSLIDSRISSNP